MENPQSLIPSPLKMSFLESFVYQEKDYAKATKEEQQSFIFEHMGIVHQQPEFLKDLTIKLHIEMIKELYGIKEDEEIQDWISSLELKVLLENIQINYQVENRYVVLYYWH